ncbi:putative serpin-Z8 [Lolium rigidum]|uniref:putative serpin-Z8 n=1 Tax=Lolium rigidum TaxID=89674 RepID=UPI001F5DDDC3|nr:putative serpin-Z8 [Lolium rigidum]
MEVPRNPTAQADTGGLAALSASLARCLAEENADSNLILRVVGARSRGELEESVAGVVETALKDESGAGGPRIAFACGVWSELTCPLKAAYRRTVVDKFSAEASSVDFISNPEAARDQINAWVAEATHDVIGSVFGPGSITTLTRVVLGNAVYFKGKWVNPFNEKRTKDKLFYRLDGSTVDTPFMKSLSSQFIAVHDGFKVIRLASVLILSIFLLSHTMGAPIIYMTSFCYADMLTGYVPSNRKKRKRMSSGRNKRTKFSICIFLPDDHDGLPNLVDMIASQPGFLHQHLPKEKVEVDEFRVPKFKLSFESSVVTILEKLGLKLPFGDQADLSDMVEPNDSGLPTVLNDIIHKAVIEVNEEGTEAAAVTFTDFEYGCDMPESPPPGVDFVADHPFAYFIVEEVTGAVIFAGRVLDPSIEN